jgi:transcriptional regulator with XRE-family HTH domain
MQIYNDISNVSNKLDNIFVFIFRLNPNKYQMIDFERFMKLIKITQIELADKLGVSQTAISMVKNGKMEMPKNWIDIIKTEYNQDITNFISKASSSIASEPQEKYETPSIRIIETITNSNQNLSASNRILVDTNKQLTETNSRLQDQLIKINEKLLRFIESKELV